MANNFYKYKVYCTTDSKYEYTDFIKGQDDEENKPTKCPVDPVGHSIDASKTDIVQSILDSQIEIKEEGLTSSGKYQKNHHQVRPCVFRLLLP